MDITACHATVGMSHVILAIVNFESDPQLQQKVERLWGNPKARKRIFKKVQDLTVDGAKIKIHYSSAESISRVKRFSEELVDSITLFAEK